MSRSPDRVILIEAGAELGVVGWDDLGLGSASSESRSVRARAVSSTGQVCGSVGHAQDRIRILRLGEQGPDSLTFRLGSYANTP